jgi:hypothetical protein
LRVAAVIKALEHVRDNYSLPEGDDEDDCDDDDTEYAGTVMTRQDIRAILASLKHSGVAAEACGQKAQTKAREWKWGRGLKASRDEQKQSAKRVWVSCPQWSTGSAVEEAMFVRKVSR